MDVFYLKTRRNGVSTEKIRVEDLMMKIDSSQEGKSGYIRGKTLVGGYADRFPLASIEFLTKDQIKTILINARDNIHSLSIMLEEAVNSNETRRDMLKRVIDSTYPMENKIRDIFT